LKLIGLTGGAGSGKSTVAQMLRDLGAVVLDADVAAHRVYEPGSLGFDLIESEFGPDYIRDGKIDRARLGELVFRDAEARARLNAIVHPLVREWMAAETADALMRGAEVVVQDVPLLFENGLERLYSDVVLVHVPEELQVERLVHERGLDEDRARAIVAAQMPIDDKRTKAGFVIDNSGSLDETRRQVEKVWVRVRAL
jgi:dephospho-CoA kinase